MIEKYKEAALTNLRNSVPKGESFAAVGFIGDDIIVRLPFKNDEEKTAMFFALGQLCRKEGETKALTIIDSYFRQAPNKEQLNYISENWDTERPGTYPESMRQSALVFSEIDFKEHHNRLLMIPYSISDGAVVLGEEIMMDDFDGGLVDCVKKGYEWTGQPEKTK